jgi:ketosteroid isomerase-like protein
MPEHPNAARFRLAFEALWQRGDLAPTHALLREDVHWVNDIGAGPWRDLHGKQAVLEMLAGWMALFDGGFEHQLIDICASDRNVIEILREVGTARGQLFDNLALYRFELDVDGAVAQVRTYDRDRDSIDAFWAAIGPVGVPGSRVS